MISSWETFVKNTTNIYGANGEEWLGKLPQLTIEIAAKYGLSQLTPVSNLSYNYVLKGLQDQREIVLKIGLDPEALAREAAALRAFAGHGTVSVVASEPGIVLLAQAMPGESLTSYFPGKDDEAIKIVSVLMKRLHQAPITTSTVFNSIEQWLSALDQECKEIAAPYLAKARSLRDKLLATSSGPVLLHGDLHHDNILSNGQDWLVIDPKGVVGDPVYEVAAFIRNPMPKLLEHPRAVSIIRHRINQFAANTGYSRQRIQDWCYVQAVLSWIWDLEENVVGKPYHQRFTEVLSCLD
ncbi:MAG: phosphotransferase [Proteobacteria bacterium]|nr:phosphotransferase [Pseudomonadota bacterium]